MQIFLYFFLIVEKNNAGLVVCEVGRSITANVEGLAMAGDFMFVCPQPKLLEKLKLKITTKSQIINVKLKPKLIAKCSRS